MKEVEPRAVLCAENQGLVAGAIPKVTTNLAVARRGRGGRTGKGGGRGGKRGGPGGKRVLEGKEVTAGAEAN